MAIVKTPRLGLTKWTEGTDPFTRQQMNDAMQSIEDIVAGDMQGLAADRPTGAQQPPRGVYYYATDTQQLLRSDGETWRPTNTVVAAWTPSLLLMGV